MPHVEIHCFSGRTDEQKSECAMRIETERLILRTFKESDYDDIYEDLSQLENDEFYPYVMGKNDCEYATYKEQAGLKKKSFELNYNGGTIWCEHLDSMGNMEAEVIKKFEEDSKTFCRPSVSSYMIINLDETTITQQIVTCIANGITACEKKFMKLAFVGVGRTEQKQFEKMMKQSGIVISYLKDYEKAKEWVLG